MSERDGLPEAQNEQPSPEEVFENTKVNIWLTDANLEKPVNCLKGVRAVFSALVGSNVSINVARPAWERYVNGERPVFLAWADGPEAAKAAAEAGLAASNDNVVIGYGLDASDIRRLRREHGTEDPQDPEAVPETPQTAPEDPTTNATAAKVALNLMAMNDGSPTKSHIFARIIAKNTGDSLWTEAAILIDRAFPQVALGDEEDVTA